jgi:hypothetical protein
MLDPFDQTLVLEHAADLIDLLMGTDASQPAELGVTRARVCADGGQDPFGVRHRRDLTFRRPSVTWSSIPPIALSLVDRKRHAVTRQRCRQSHVTWPSDGRVAAIEVKAARDVGEGDFRTGRAGCGTDRNRSQPKSTSQSVPSAL